MGAQQVLIFQPTGGTVSSGTALNTVAPSPLPALL